MSHWRLFSWVNSARLKPFMDSYHAPYKAKHRYWPGLLLVFRFVLLLVSAFEFNPQRDSSTNLLAILVATGVLVVWACPAWLNGGVYRSWCFDALEGPFVLNLIFLVRATFFCETHRRRSACSWLHLSLNCICYIHWDPCLLAGKCDWHWPIHEK